MRKTSFGFKICLFAGSHLKKKKIPISIFAALPPPHKKIPGDVFSFFFLKDEFNDAVHDLNHVMGIIKFAFLLTS